MPRNFPAHHGEFWLTTTRPVLRAKRHRFPHEIPVFLLAENTGRRAPSPKNRCFRGRGGRVQVLPRSPGVRSGRNAQWSNHRPADVGLRPDYPLLPRTTLLRPQTKKKDCNPKHGLRRKNTVFFVISRPLSWMPGFFWEQEAACSNHVAPIFGLWPIIESRWERVESRGCGRPDRSIRDCRPPIVPLSPICSVCSPLSTRSRPAPPHHTWLSASANGPSAGKWQALATAG
jgi:hypothetical protein